MEIEKKGQFVFEFFLKIVKIILLLPYACYKWRSSKTGFCHSLTILSLVVVSANWKAFCVPWKFIYLFLPGIKFASGSSDFGGVFPSLHNPHVPNIFCGPYMEHKPGSEGTHQSLVSGKLYYSVFFFFPPIGKSGLSGIWCLDSMDAQGHPMDMLLISEQEENEGGEHSYFFTDHWIIQLWPFWTIVYGISWPNTQWCLVNSV